MDNKGFKKVNLVPKSYFLLKKLNIVQYVAIGIALVAILITSFVSVSQIFKFNDVENQVSEANQIIARADFAKRDSLKTRLEYLKAAGDAGNFNTIPNVYEDMTDFLTCIVRNMPETMIVENIDGEFTMAGVYSYSFAFTSTERSTIAPFLQALQSEETLKYVNISAITLDGDEIDISGGENNTDTEPDVSTTPDTDPDTDPSDVVDDAVQEAEGTWKFTLVIKTKGGVQ